MDNRREFIVIVAGLAFHHEIADRLQRIADKMSTPLHIVTVDDIHTLSSNVNQPLEDILSLLEQCSLPKPRSITDDLENLSKLASKMDFNKQYLQSPVIEQDDRPWYEKAANKGGKKRKQNYNNKQPWRR